MLIGLTKELDDVFHQHHTIWNEIGSAKVEKEEKLNKLISNVKLVCLSVVTEEMEEKELIKKEIHNNLHLIITLEKSLGEPSYTVNIP